MKKLILILACVLFVLIMLYPLGIAITACFGYSFELVSISAFSIAIAVLSVCIVALDVIFDSPDENVIMRILSAVITPLSLVNAALYIFKCPRIWIIASVLISVGCCCYLTIKHTKRLAIKAVSLCLSALMLLSIGFLGFIALIFGNIAQNTVVQTVESLSGKYYAQVIDSDQGALGGDTIVDVYENGINAFVFKIENKPQQVYLGDWGEFKNMQIYWKDDDTLIINSVEYEVE